MLPALEPQQVLKLKQLTIMTLAETAKVSNFLKFPAIVFLHSSPSGIQLMYHLWGCASTGVVISAIC